MPLLGSRPVAHRITVVFHLPASPPTTTLQLVPLLPFYTATTNNDITAAIVTVICLDAVFCIYSQTSY